MSSDLFHRFLGAMLLVEILQILSSVLQRKFFQFRTNMHVVQIKLHKVSFTVAVLQDYLFNNPIDPLTQSQRHKISCIYLSLRYFIRELDMVLYEE